MLFAQKYKIKRIFVYKNVKIMSGIAPSELIINSDGSIFHLHLKPEELADTVLLVGDPGRVELIASYFDSTEFRRESREFVTVTGKYKNKRITILSTGIGTDNIDIVVNELDALANIDFKTREPKRELKTLTLIRLGTSGAIQPDIPLGSFVLSHYSIGFDGLLNWYANRNSVSNTDMENAFMKYMDWPKELPWPYFASASNELIELFKNDTLKGVTISAPGFYGPQGRVLRIDLGIENFLDKLENFKYDHYKITNFEMEGSALSGLSHHLGHKAATICCIIANRHLKESEPDYKAFIKRLVEMVLEKITG